jgi:hypothetical protein
MTIVLREGGLVARDPVPHDGDCGLWSGQVRGFVSTLRKHQTKGVLGQSPKKDPHRLEAARWRLRFVLGESQGLRINA